ncbi:potassium-transporting ATPase subunit F [Paenibacillus sp. CFBP 13594]|nr:potassium-transporting ATPase subunit F [Paenibacillus sp. CFBP 13594]
MGICEILRKGLRVERGSGMIAIGMIVLALVIYLGYVLVKPEKF